MYTRACSTSRQTVDERPPQRRRKRSASTRASSRRAWRRVPRPRNPRQRRTHAGTRTAGTPLVYRPDTGDKVTMKVLSSIYGAQPVTDFKAAIDAALELARCIRRCAAGECRAETGRTRSAPRTDPHRPGIAVPQSGHVPSLALCSSARSSRAARPAASARTLHRVFPSHRRGRAGCRHTRSAGRCAAPVSAARISISGVVFSGSLIR